MKGQIRQVMTEALAQTACVVICLTKMYEAKINSASLSDNCYFEFNYASIHPQLSNARLVIALEKEMANPKNWNEEGRLFAELRGDLILELSNTNDEELFSKQIDELERALKFLLKISI